MTSPFERTEKVRTLFNKSLSTHNHNITNEFPRRSRVKTQRGMLKTEINFFIKYPNP